jgi:hypothetical protein
MQSAAVSDPDQPPWPATGIVDGIMHMLVSKVQVVGLQVMLPTPMFIKLQLVVTGRLGSQVSPIAGSTMPLPQGLAVDGFIAVAPPAPIVPRLDASTQSHGSFQVPVGKQVLTAAYIGAGHCGVV